MIEPFIYASPPLLYFGVGKFNSVPGIVKQFGSNILFITGSSSFHSSVNYQLLNRAFMKKGFSISEESVTSEPSPKLVDEITTKYRDNNINAIIAIGGGSVIDAGKAISAMLPLTDSVMDYLEGVGTGIIHTGEKIPFIAVPTTAGTGSEATKNAVLCRVGTEGFKRSLRHTNFVPNVAVVDPVLTLSCPQSLTAYCGMDAFTQLLESYLSSEASRMTDMLCMDGLRCINWSLPSAINDLENLEARTGMSYAAFLSGVALANAGLGVVHGFASSIGGRYNIPHGIICGTMMAICNRITVKRIREKQKGLYALTKYAELGKLFAGDDTQGDNYYVDAFLDILDDWTHAYNIPKLGTFNVKESDAEQIAANTDYKNNPVKLTAEDLIIALKTRI